MEHMMLKHFLLNIKQSNTVLELYPRLDLLDQYVSNGVCNCFLQVLVMGVETDHQGMQRFYYAVKVLWVENHESSEALAGDFYDEFSTLS